MSMKEFAKHVIAVANENQLSVTNLQLQKVMYFSLKTALDESLLNEEVLKNLYDTPFLVWRYGPVEKDVYDTYKIFGADPIIEDDVENKSLKPLNKVIVNNLKEDPFSLVNKSHREKYWAEHESDITGWRSNIEYTFKDIKSEV